MDKQDELAAVIRAAEFAWVHNDPVARGDKGTAIAAAVRSFMGSEEAVERVARAICKVRFLVWDGDDDDGWLDASEELREQYLKEARAALSAAIGGGGRGRGGEDR